MKSLARLALSVAVLAPAAPLAAQTLVPDVGEPGDLVVFEGSGLGATKHVDFFAIVGGFVGSEHVVVPPLSVSDTRVEVQVPPFFHFLPPPPFADGEPIGHVTLLDASFAQISAQQPFWYLEITFGAVQTKGAASPLADGGLSSVAFEHAGGAPAAGNSAFELQLQGGAPGAAAFVLAGRPDTPPHPVVNGGQLVTDLTVPFLLLGPYAVDGQGRAEAPLAVPASVAGLTIMLQWAFHDPQDHALRLSNGLQATL